MTTIPRIAVFSAKQWVIDAFTAANAGHRFDLNFLETRLAAESASLAAGHDAVCVFVNDTVEESVLRTLADLNVRLIALRCSGFNNVALKKAAELGIAVVRVPAYSPYAVAEHTLGLMLALNRKYHRAYNRIREGNFALDGLLGFDINQKTVGVIGTGKIGLILLRLLRGFDCRLLVYDKFENETARELGAEYVPLDVLYRESDILSLHCPLTHETYHMINHFAISTMKPGVMIINTSRGALINTGSVIEGLKSGRIGYLGLDVYEEEADLFFEDLSNQAIQDDQFVRLQTFPNVLITGHQAFFTREAVGNIADTTLGNIHDILTTGTSPNAVIAEDVYSRPPRP
jgi:D-lactate dehydrogenase